MPATEFQISAVSDKSLEDVQSEIASYASGIIGIIGGDWECIDENVFEISQAQQTKPNVFIPEKTGKFKAWMKFIRHEK
jgi:hypothetical protein